MKRAICYFIAFFCVLTFMSMTVSAANAELEKSSSITVTYKDGEVAFSGLEIKTYRIADVSEDGKYTLCGDFKDYPVSLYDVASQAEWNNIASTLANYAVADNITPTNTSTTDNAGTIKLTELLPGMYLTLSAEHENSEQITFFENFLTAVPAPVGDGTYNYDIAAFPKSIKHTPNAEKIHRKVIKQWKDNGSQLKRPEEIKVDIYKDGKLQETVSLCDSNNWIYEWSCLNDGSKWTAVERDIPADYKVAIAEHGNTIIITNVYFNEDVSSPQTGDTSNFELYIIIMCICGLIIVFLSLWKKRSEV